MYFDYQKDQDWYLGPKHQWNVRICFDIIFMSEEYLLLKKVGL